VGLLRDLQTRSGKIAYLPGMQTDCDEPDWDGGLEAYEQMRWAKLEALAHDEKQRIKSQVLAELRCREVKEKKRGRPASLVAYRDYQRQFIQEWARHISKQAKKSANPKYRTQTGLAVSFNLKEDSDWRVLLRGGKKSCYKMNYQRMTASVRAIVYKEGWHVARNGNMTTFKPMLYMTEPQFLKWLGIEVM